MATFEDTPKWKREMRWDPVKQKLVRPDRPPTRKQVDFLRALHEERGLVFVVPATRREAAASIDRMRTRGGRRG